MTLFFDQVYRYRCLWMHFGTICRCA